MEVQAGGCHERQKQVAPVVHAVVIEEDSHGLQALWGIKLDDSDSGDTNNNYSNSTGQNQPLKTDHASLAC